MRQLMNKGGEDFGLRLTGQDGDATAIAHAESGCDVLGEDKLDSLTIYEGKQTVVVFAHVAIDLTHCGKVDAIGLLHVEDIGIAEANKDAGVLLGNVLLGFLIGLALDADDGSQNANAFLALLHPAAKLVPRIHTRNSGSRRSLPCNFEDVAKAVVVKAAHRVEI